MRDMAACGPQQRRAAPSWSPASSRPSAPLWTSSPPLHQALASLLARLCTACQGLQATAVGWGLAVVGRAIASLGGGKALLLLTPQRERSAGYCAARGRGGAAPTARARRGWVGTIHQADDPLCHGLRAAEQGIGAGSVARSAADGWGPKGGSATSCAHKCMAGMGRHGAAPAADELAAISRALGQLARPSSASEEQGVLFSGW